MGDATDHQAAVRAARTQVQRLHDAIRDATATVERSHQTVEAARAILAPPGPPPSAPSRYLPRDPGLLRRVDRPEWAAEPPEPPTDAAPSP